MSNNNLRQIITATKKKAESCHTLEDWIRFGSKYLVASNEVDGMEKAVKHTDLIANCIMLKNVRHMLFLDFEVPLHPRN